MGPVGEIINKAEYPNHAWSYDFIEDRTERGGKLMILAIINEYARECLLQHNSNHQLHLFSLVFTPLEITWMSLQNE